MPKFLHPLFAPLAKFLAYFIYVYRFLARNRTVRNALLLFAFAFTGVYIAFGEEAAFTFLAFVAQLAFAAVFMIAQFVFLFMFLARSKTVTIVPGDGTGLTLRDYKGQPALIKAMEQWLGILKGDKEFENMGGRPPKGLLLFGGPGTGKAIAVTEMVPTDNLPKRAGDVRVGDRLIGLNGAPTTVLGVFPQGRKPLFRVRLSDGDSCLVTGDHLWVVQDRRTRSWVKITTQEMADLGLRIEKNAARRFRLPRLSQPAQLTGLGPLPIDPYIMGLLLSEGGLTQSIVFSTSDHEIAERVRATLGNDAVKFYSGYDYAILGETSYQLARLGLAGRPSEEKFIPLIYLHAPAMARAELLRGIMDGDGSIDQTRTSSACDYTTVSPRLADEVEYLVKSLGGTVTRSMKIPHYDYYGEKRSGQMAYRLYIIMPSEVNPFWLHRKAYRFDEYAPLRRMALDRYVVGIDSEGPGEAICFLVDAKDHLFCVGKFIPTHNTYLLRCVAGEANIAMHAIEGSGFRAMFVGLDVLKVLQFCNKARNLALEYGAAIAYIDELDSIAMSRGGVQGGQAQVISPMGFLGSGGGLTALLAQIDGFGDEREFTKCQNVSRRWFGLPRLREGTILFVGSTNRPDVLDPAITRPGRLSKHIQVDVPDANGRKEIFGYYLSKIAREDNIDLDSIVATTHGVTPAHIAVAVTEDAVRNARFANRTKINQEDIEWAILEQVTGFANPIGDMPEEQKWQVCVHEAGHAVALYHLRKDKRVSFVSTVRRGAALGFMLPVDVRASYAIPLTSVIADIRISMAGDIATKVVLKERWTGAASDIEHILRRVQYLAWHGVFGGLMTSTRGDLPANINDRVQGWIQEQWEATEKLCVEHRTEIEAIARELMVKEELSGRMVIDIIEEAVRQSQEGLFAPAVAGIISEDD